MFIRVALYLTITYSSCSTSCPQNRYPISNVSGTVQEFYRLKAFITLEQVITSVVEKKDNLNEQNFEVYWEIRIEDRGLRIGDK